MFFEPNAFRSDLCWQLIEGEMGQIAIDPIGAAIVAQYA